MNPYFNTSKTPYQSELDKLKTTRAILSKENEALREALYAANDLLCGVERGETVDRQVEVFRQKLEAFNKMSGNPVFRVDVKRVK